MFLFRGTSSPLPLTALLWFLGVHTLWLSRTPYESFLTVLGWLPGFLVAVAMEKNSGQPGGPEVQKRVAVVVDILAVVAILSTGPGILGIWATQSWMTTPLIGTFYWHNQMAIYLVMVLLPFGVRLMMVKPRARISYLLVTGYLVAAFLMARSVGALLMLLMGLAYFGFRMWGAGARRHLWVALVPLVILASLLPFPKLYSPYITRVLALIAGGHSAEARLDYWAAAWAMFTKNPVTGAGLGSFEYLFPQYQRNLATFSNDPHNFLMQSLAETGILGTLFILGFLIWLAWQMIRAKPAVEVAPLAFALEAAVLAGLLHSLIDFDWKFPALMMTLLLLAALRMSLGTTGVPFVAPEAGKRRRKSPPRSARRTSQRWRAPGRFAFAVAAGGFLLFWVLESPGYLRLKAYSQKPDMMGTAEGRIYLERALRLFPWNPPVNYAIGRDALGSEPIEGKKYAERALKLNPFHPDYHLLVAQYAFREGRFAEAEEQIEAALALDRWNRPYLYRELAQLQLWKGEWDKAQKTLEQALEKYPFRTAEEAFSGKLEFRKMGANKTLADLHAMLATIYEIRGESEKAREHREWASALEEEK
jgi:hypothetical protein